MNHPPLVSLLPSQMDHVVLGGYDQALLAGAASALVICIVRTWLRSRSKAKLLLPLPPGPPLYPFIGALRVMPAAHEWVTFAEWSKTWGEWPSALPALKYIK